MTIENTPLPRLIEIELSKTTHEELDEIILGAIKNAPTLEKSPGGRSDKLPVEEASRRYSEYKNASPHTKIKGRSVIYGAALITRESHFYPILIRRVLELTFPFCTKEELTAHILASVEHEMDHAAAAYMLDKEVSYGVRITKHVGENGNLNPGVVPFILVHGQSTKAEIAFINTIGSELSETDLAVMHSLGYHSIKEISVSENFSDGVE